MRAAWTREGAGRYDAGVRGLPSLLLSLALVSPAKAASPPDARVSVDFKDVDVVDVARLFAEVGGFQLVVDPGVSCKLTLKLSEVPWTAALDLAL